MAKSVTVKVGADMSEFNKELKSANGNIRETTTQATQLQKSLELKFDETKFAQAQQLAQKALTDTGDKAEKIKLKLKELEDAGKVDSASYTKLQTELIKTELQAEKLERQLKQINQIKFDALANQFNKIGDGISTAGKALLPFSAAASAAIAGVIGLGLNAVKTADQIQTLANQTGMTAEEIQKLQYLALQSDVPFDKLQKSFIKARSSLIDLSKGITNEGSKALAELNIDLSQFNNSDEYFQGVLLALSQLPSELEQVAYANAIFGDKLGNDLLPLLKMGADGISQLADEYSALGGMSNDTVAKLAEFDNVMNKIKTQIGNVLLQIGVSFLPVLEKLATIINDRILPVLQAWSDKLAGLSEDQLNFILKVLAVVAVSAPLLLIIGKLTTGIGSLISILPKLGSAMSALAANPIVAIIGVLAILIGILYTQSEAFRESIQELVTLLGGLLAPIFSLLVGILQTVVQALSPLLVMLGNLLGAILTPLIKILTPILMLFETLMQVLMPLISIALLPLTIALTLLEIPLQLLAYFLQPLIYLMELLGTVIVKVFNFIQPVIGKIVTFLESAVNGVINFINSIIDGINSLSKWIGITLPKLDAVTFKIQETVIGEMNNTQPNNTNTMPNFDNSWLDNISGGNSVGDNNTFNDNRNPTINVIINNYSAELDIEDAIAQINRKLAEAY